MPEFVETHVTWLVMLALTPLAKRPVAVSVLVPPARTMFTSGRSVMLRSGLTCPDAAPVTPPTDAPIVVVPAAFPVTTPLGLTVAMAADEELHAAEALRSRTVLSEEWPVA